MRRFTILAILATLVGCSHNSEELDSINIPLKNQTEFYASMPECDTRTYVEDNKHICWNAGDEITIFNGNSYNSHWQFAGEDGANSGKFNEIEESGFVTGTPLDLTANYAIYPYDENITITEAGVVALTLPAVQEYNHTYANSFGVGANTMMAVTKNTSDNFLAFKNLCGYLKLKFYGDDVTVKSVAIKGNNNEKIAGNATVTMAYDDEPTITMGDDADHTITIDCGEGITLSNDSENPTIFWAVIPETTFEGGITITVTDTNDQIFTRSTTKVVPITNNIIQPMAALEVVYTKLQPNNEIWYTATEKVEPYDKTVFGATYQSNEWNEATGEGVITFDREITSIGDYAFQDCSSLTSVTFPSSVTSIGKFAFSGSSLTSITIPDSVTSIGEQAFLRCSSLTSVTIPNSITSIGIYTFKRCSSLTSVTIPDSVTSIGDYAFACCSSLKAFYGKFASADNRCLIIDGVLNSFAPAGLTEYVIPDSVTSIGGQAFLECSNLKSVTIPNSVTEIGNWAFKNCSGLTSVIIGNSVTSIGRDAFRECSSLTSATIGNSVASIGVQAFFSCSSLKSITIPNSVTEIGDWAFKNCSGLTSVIIGNSVTEIGKDVFVGCTGTLIVNCNIPSASSDTNGVFYGSKFTEVTIGNSVTEIGERAFYICNSLTSITFGDSVTSIGKDAFRNCSSLTSVTIPDSVTSIGRAAFYDCTSLTSVTIGNGVASIGQDAFRNCSSLTSVTIPDSVTSIGRAAFDVCSSLTSVYCKPTTPPAGGQYMFDQSASGRKIYVPYNSVDTYKQAEYWSSYASDIVGYDFEIDEVVDIQPNNEIWYTSTDGNIVTPYATDVFGANIVSNTYENGQGIIKFDAPITSIGEYAFNKRTRLSSVTIPYGVTWIGANAFRSCSNLASVTIPNSVTWIGADAFYGCSSLKGVYISDITAWCYIYFQQYNSNPLYYAHNLYLNNKLVTDLIIPDSATAISQYAFINCSNLTSITIGKGVGEIEKAAFSGCKGKLIINSRKVVEGDYLSYGYPSSEDGWLSGAKFTSVTIGNGIKEIGQYVFYNCSSLTSVTIPDSITSIGYYAFRNCSSLTGVYISDIAAWCNISINTYGDPLYYARKLYLNNELVTNLTIPDSVTIIRRNAFAYCSSLEAITIPSSVTVIGAAAFEDCNNLKRVTISDGVNTIGDGAFYRCSALQSITIPNSVTRIGACAFQNCTILASVYCKATTPPSLDEDAFENNKDSRYIYVPSASVGAYKEAWSVYKSSIKGLNF